ncbi:hypothetical protein IWW47_003617 [Coemansia sp. RSA 2052]|nr:hypothetical protein IWW47_003617 [Coemansia sp. RSA 2052]
METKHSTKGQAVDNLFNDVFDHFDASPSSPRSPDSAKLELLEETDNKPSSCMRISPPSASPSKHTSSRSILN